MKSPLILMLLLFVGDGTDGIKTVKFYEDTEENLTACTHEAEQLNWMVEQLQQNGLDEEVVRRMLITERRLRWIAIDEVEKARFECHAAIVMKDD